jgi:hypothetical protein
MDNEYLGRIQLWCVWIRYLVKGTNVWGGQVGQGVTDPGQLLRSWEQMSRGGSDIK